MQSDQSADSPTVTPPVTPAAPISRLALRGGPAGNERLTAWAGALLFGLLALEGVTILAMDRFRVEHIVIGVALLGPVALKLGSTGYRFVRYYAGDQQYRRKGPPRLWLRLLAPVLIVLTLEVLVSGLAIPVSDTHRRLFEQLHKLGFIAWIAVAALHVLAYVWRVPRLVLHDLRELAGARSRSAETSGAGSRQRLAITGLSLLAGLAAAAVVYPYVR